MAPTIRPSWSNLSAAPKPSKRWQLSRKCSGDGKTNWRAMSVPAFVRRPSAMSAARVVQFINKVTIVATLYLGAKVVMAGELTVGELVAFNMLAGRVAQPVLRIAQLWQDFQQARLSIARLGDILNTQREPAQKAAASLPSIKGDIRFEHVTFRYQLNGPTVLSDVSLHVPPGQVIGIVGPSGSGKSTLAKLVQRLYAPESGRVLIDGIDLAMVDTAWLRHQIGVVLQDNVLFNCSVRENIALADPGAPIEQIIRAATLSGAHDFILELPQGYDTMIGERGASLSGRPAPTHRDRPRANGESAYPDFR